MGALGRVPPPHTERACGKDLPSRAEGSGEGVGCGKVPYPGQRGLWENFFHPKQTGGCGKGSLTELT